MTSRTHVGLVTGAASGIGRALVARIASEGWRVLATDVNEDALLQAFASDGWPAERVRSHVLDVTCTQSWSHALTQIAQSYGTLDVLFNVAGYLRPAYLADISGEDIQRMLEINIAGVMLGTQAAAAVMRPSGTGHIVNVSSLAGLAPIPGLSVYSATKFAVRGFSLAVAQELHAEGIAVTVVYPDAVQTPMLDSQVDHDAAALTFSGVAPLTVDEVCDAICGPVLRRRPLEWTLPRGRGAMARAAGSFPGLARVVGPMLSEKGRKRQAALRRRSEHAREEE